MTHTHIAIIGGGIAGLSTAYHLQKAAAEAEQPISYTLLEQSDRWGGKIATETITEYSDEPFIVEGGPDSFITQKPWALQLARELELDDELLPTNDHLRKTFVLNKGKPTPLPDGVLLIVPTKIKPFALSTLISPLGKLRMGMDLFIPPKMDDEDETLAQFIERRLGSEALDKIAEPLMSGIYNADAQMQSLMATFPRFRAIEQKYGSLTKGMIAGQKARAQAASNGASNGSHPPKPQTSMFMSMQKGMDDFVAEIQARLTGDLRLETAVTKIEISESALSLSKDQRSENEPSTTNLQSPISYTLTLSDGSTLSADKIILAVPAFVAAKLLADLSPHAAKELDAIRYVSTGTISLGYRRDELNHPLDGFGIVIPRSEKRKINAITWSSTKFNQRAPNGYALLRIFFGGSRTPEMMEADDTKILSTVRRELQEIMGVNANPLFHRIYRWQRSNPQYDVGHLDRVDAIEKAMPQNIFVTGSPYRGIGIPDCVRQGKETAQKVIDDLQLQIDDSITRQQS
jgi:oxygen-dependent protoporphyrinogen oxidase